MWHDGSGNQSGQGRGGGHAGRTATPGFGGEEGVYTVRTEEATRERPMGGDDSATLGEETVRGLANVQLHYRGQQDLPPVRAPGELVREERARCALPQRASEILEAAPPPGPPGPLPSGLS